MSSFLVEIWRKDGRYIKIVLKKASLLPVAQTTVKDMNREQELDQYEDHDTWLKMVKQDWYSFQRLKEAQTDQQRKVCMIIINNTFNFLSQTQVACEKNLRVRQE